ncbi:hypothetical protein GN956_G11652 [Arapaima gigas]
MAGGALRRTQTAGSGSELKTAGDSDLEDILHPDPPPRAQLTRSGRVPSVRNKRQTPASFWKPGWNPGDEARMAHKTSPFWHRRGWLTRKEGSRVTRAAQRRPPLGLPQVQPGILRT